MAKVNNKWLWGTIAPAVLVSLLAGFAPAAAASDTLETGRVAGDSRYSTSVEIAKKAFPSTSKVYVANGVSYVDALAGASLGDAPVILISKEGNKEVKEYLKGKTVVVLGGKSAISDEVLKANGVDINSTRLAGETRYETAKEIFKASGRSGRVDSVTVVSGENSHIVDALLSPSLGKSIILANKYGEFDETADYCVGYACGLPGVKAKKVTELKGDDRVSTAIAVASHVFKSSVPAVYLVNADKFVDALPGGVLRDGPILLVSEKSGKGISEAKKFISDHNAQKVIALGGERAISSSLLKKLASKAEDSNEGDSLGNGAVNHNIVGSEDPIGHEDFEDHQLTINGTVYSVYIDEDNTVKVTPVSGAAAPKSLEDSVRVPRKDFEALKERLGKSGLTLQESDIIGEVV